MRWSTVSSIGVFALGVSIGAHADLWGYVDDAGRSHLSTVKVDERYKLFKLTPRKAPDEAKDLAVTAVLMVPDIPASKIKRYKKNVAKIAKKYDLEPALIHAVISAESQYDAAAVSMRGAAGLMQLMPETADRYKVGNVFDPDQNLLGGARYLRYLLKLFDGNLELALAAYNAGENAVIRHGRKIPPYRQTANYVPKVLAYYKKYQQKI
jgi:soluble lytic murein transglycosylase-like protein